MRDGAGNGNNYFDDLFANGIPWNSLIFFCLNGGIGCINMILAPLFFYIACLKQSYHKNLKLVTSNLYLAFFLSGLGNFAYSIMVLMHISDREHDSTFTLFRFIITYGSNLCEITFFGIILERSAATIWYKTYEKRGSFMLAFILFCIELLCSLIAASYYYIRINYLIITGMIISLNLICLILILIIFMVNKKMLKLKNNATINLSQRYQITENLRFLFIMKPLIVICSLLEIITVIAASVEATLDYKNTLYFPIYLLFTNSIIFIFNLLYLKLDSSVKRKLFNLLHIKLSTIGTTHREVKNVVGEHLVIKETPEIHFKQLNQYWS